MSRRGFAGPPAELVAFVADQYDRVLGSLVLLTGDRQLAAELAQEAFVRVCQNWEKVSAMDAPGAWVHRVGMNLGLSALRRERNRRRATERLRVVQGDNRTAPPDTGRADEVRAALAALPPDQRAVVVLRFHADLSVGDTAAALGVPQGTVKTRTRAALAALREMGLDEAEVEEEVAP